MDTLPMVEYAMTELVKRVSLCGQVVTWVLFFMFEWLNISFYGRFCGLEWGCLTRARFPKTFKTPKNLGNHAPEK